jgi:hypothetical protein
MVPGKASHNQSNLLFSKHIFSSKIIYTNTNTNIRLGLKEARNLFRGGVVASFADALKRFEPTKYHSGPHLSDAARNLVGQRANDLRQLTVLRASPPRLIALHFRSLVKVSLKPHERISNRPYPA